MEARWLMLGDLAVPVASCMELMLGEALTYIAEKKHTSMLCDNLEGWDGMGGGGVEEGGYVYLLMADSYCYVAEANTIL